MELTWWRDMLVAVILGGAGMWFLLRRQARRACDKAGIGQVNGRQPEGVARGRSDECEGRASGSGSQGSSGCKRPYEQSIGRFCLEDILQHATGDIFENPEAAKAFECPICLVMLEDPMQLVCDGRLEGHRVCRRCLRDIQRCPLCNVPCEPGREDRAAVRDIRSLRARCTFCNGWSGSVLELEQHCSNCPDASEQLPRICPVKGCGFSTKSEDALRLHFCRQFLQHVDLTVPKPAPFHTHASKDTAQIYIPDLAAMEISGASMGSPAFFAGNGYCCCLRAEFQDRSLKCILKLHRSASMPQAVFPFAVPFVFHICNPDDPGVILHKQVDFHLSAPTRVNDANINPQAESRAWTGGISHNFERSSIQAINKRHLLVIVTIMPRSDAGDALGAINLAEW